MLRQQIDSGPIPCDGGPGEQGYAWPTWREALADAQKGIDNAYERRKRVFQAAYDAGLTLAEIGEVVGLSAAGVHKIVGRQRGGVNLDAPAFLGRES